MTHLQGDVIIAILCNIWLMTFVCACWLAKINGRQS